MVQCLQRIGHRSKENLSRLVFNKDVRDGWEKRDNHNRIVGNVLVHAVGCSIFAMTLDSGHAQITAGLAWSHREYANEQSPQDRGAYEFRNRRPRRSAWGYGANLIQCRLGSGGGGSVSDGIAKQARFGRGCVKTQGYFSRVGKRLPLKR